MIIRNEMIFSFNAQSIQQRRHTVEFRLQPKRCALYITYTYIFFNGSKSCRFWLKKNVLLIFDKMARDIDPTFFLVISDFDKSREGSDISRSFFCKRSGGGGQIKLAAKLPRSALLNPVPNNRRCMQG